MKAYLPLFFYILLSTIPISMTPSLNEDTFIAPMNDASIPIPHIVKVSNCIWWEDYWTMMDRPDIAATHGLGNGTDQSRDLIPFSNITFLTWSNGTVTMEPINIDEWLRQHPEFP
jgi:hypothetical protein